LLHLEGQLKPTHVILPEFSVTATENALLAAALLPGETRIDIAPLRAEEAPERAELAPLRAEEAPERAELAPLRAEEVVPVGTH
jgi:hypothetical protein